MIELCDRVPRRSASHLYEVCKAAGIGSLVDPLMGLPTHLNFLKRHGIAVHGGDPVEWFCRVGQGIVVNDSVILRDFEVAEIVEMAPGRIYPPDLFLAWEGVFFTPDQCRYLAAWHENARNLRSDGQTGLAVLGLWWTFAYWLQKIASPDDLLDVPPSELAYAYIRKTERWVGDNARHNSVHHGSPLDTMARVSADAVLLTLPSLEAGERSDARTWMWEAWWQGNPYRSIEGDSGTPGMQAGPGWWREAFAAQLEGARKYPLAIVAVKPAERTEAEALLHDFRPRVETRAFSGQEAYLLAG